MTPFAREDDGTIDTEKLARLMGTDGTLGDSIMDRKRSYLVGNAMCGDTTIDNLAYGCESLDDGVGGQQCDRFVSACPGNGSTATKRPARKTAKYKK